ncbi:MAG: flagellar hook-associated protein FlgK, partial [Acidimicrobiales bacterium]
MSMQGLNTGYTGVIAAQTAIDVAANNVANVGTDGYTRQRAEFRSRLPRLTQQGFIGTGVDAYDVTRARDGFLDARVRTGQTTLGAMVANSQLMKRAESVLGEPNFGISNELDNLFASFEEVALNPNDNAAKVAAVTAMEAVAARVRGVAVGFKKLQTDSAENLSTEIKAVNAALEEVARLNVAIKDAATSGFQPNDLLDERDVLLDELARKIGSRVIDNGDGSIRVSLNGLALVDGDSSRPLSLNLSTFDITHPTGVSVSPGGEIGGAQNFLTQDVPNLLATLNTFAADLTTAFNTQHNAGFYNATNNGADLFSVTVGSEAET